MRRADFIRHELAPIDRDGRQAGIFDPIEKGIIGWDKIHELGEILNGSFPGRTSDEQITLHANNNGTAAADLAIAQWVHERCREMGRGSPIELPRSGEQ